MSTTGWRRIRISAVLLSHLRALALQPVPPSSLSFSLSLLSLHLLGLALVSRLAHWPLWFAPLLLAAFCLPQLLLRRWLVESLAPLFALYFLAVLRFFVVYALGQEVPASLSYEAALAVSGVWAGLIYLKAVRRLRYAWAALALAASAWLAYLSWANQPAGVTGSDPFVYAQMGIDLARRGTPRHLFPLAPFAAGLGLPTLPTTHVGYVLPDAQGLAPTVWPPGYSLLLAIAYRAAGEKGMLSLNVWIGLASMALTLGLTVLLCPARWRHLALGAGLGAAAIAATSPEQFIRLVVPLADGAAQLLTTVAIGGALYAVRFLNHNERKGVVGNVKFLNIFASFAPPLRSSRLSSTLGLLTGLAIATAYSMRYTQVLIGPGILAGAWAGIRDAHCRRVFVGTFILAALIGATPDAAYRTSLYGAPWRFGTGELALFAWGAFPEALSRLGAEWLSGREFGWLWPLAVVGVVYLWRRNRFALSALTLTCGPLVVFHLWYPFLRLRDLLSIYPPLAALCGIGGAVVVMALARRGTAVRLATIIGLFALVGLRLASMPGAQPGFFTFGYLRAEQRQDLERIDSLTEPGAVIACSLNSGAVELYGRRETVRPGNLLQPGLGWGTEQWLTFVSALRNAKRPLYLLIDSPEMDAPLEAVRARYGVRQVAELRVPVYFAGGGSENMTVPLYRVEP